MNLPLKIEGLGHPITITERDLPADGPRGWFDERTLEIVIDQNLPKPAKYQVLFHELLHLVDTTLIHHGITKRRINHGFIHHGSSQLTMMLAACGLLNGLSAEEARAFFTVEDHGPTE